MQVVQQFQQSLQKANTRGSRLLLAVSGGIDSVVLCELCRQAGVDFIIAHCNFQLRGEESERDERFVKELATKYGVDIRVKKFDTEKYAGEKKVSIQVAARELRYDWFKSLVEADKLAEYVLTAHHADDNAETVLMNFCRGTGLHGLTGIPFQTGYLLRPLLAFSKQDLLEFANQHQLSFVEDSSNRSSKYTRNLFRNEIIPLAEKVYPQLKENLQDNIERFTAIEELYKLATGELKRKLCRSKGRELHIPVRQLMKYNNRALVYDIIADYGFSEKQVEEVIKLAASDSGKYIVSPAGNYQLIKHRHWFIIAPQKDPAAATIIIEESDRLVNYEGGSLQLEKMTAKNITAQADNRLATMDSKGIEFPLLLRRWKQGDYFYPLGMKKKKKLSRFFIDQKLSKSSKENVWVLEMNKKIVWVVGMRIDDRYKLTEHTKEALQVSFMEKG